LVWDVNGRRLGVCPEVILGRGREEKIQSRFLVPRSGPFRWRVEAICDSYAGLDVDCEVCFEAKRRNEVSREIIVHPEDLNLKSFFDELMEGLQPPEEDSDDDEEEDEAPVVEVQQPKPVDPDMDQWDLNGEQPEAEGLYYRIVHPEGGVIHSHPSVDARRIGKVNKGQVVRAFVHEVPERWVELAGFGGAWLCLDAAEKTGEAESEQQPAGNDDTADASAVADSDKLDQAVKEPKGDSKKPDEAVAREARGATDGSAAGRAPPSGNVAICMGALAEQEFQTVVKTVTPIYHVQRWMKRAPARLQAEDVLSMSSMESFRLRSAIEQMAREREGEAKWESLLDESEELEAKRRKRLAAVAGIWMSPNGVVWHVSPLGGLRGRDPRGENFRDRVEIVEDELRIGPFTLVQRPDPNLHWVHKEQGREMTWRRDRSLSTRLSFGSIV